MNFTEAVNLVVDITGRPDKITRIRTEINAVLNFFCGEADFARQLVEGTAALDPTLYAQSIALSEFPRWKKFVWMRVQGSSCFITPLDVHDSLKKSNEKWINRYYVAGDSLIIKTNLLGSTLEVGYMTYPAELSDASPTHWLLEASPYMIVYMAAARIFRNIGEPEDAARHEADARTMFLSAKSDFATGIQRGR